MILELMNVYSAALARRISIPTTKEGWIAVIVGAIVLFGSQWGLGKLLEGTSLEDNTKQAICKYVPYVIAFIVMCFIIV